MLGWIPCCASPDPFPLLLARGIRCAGAARIGSGAAAASPQSIWLSYTHLGPIQIPPQPMESSSKAEDGVELLLKKPELELLDKEGQEALTFTVDLLKPFPSVC